MVATWASLKTLETSWRLGVEGPVFTFAAQNLVGVFRMNLAWLEKMICQVQWRTSG